MAPVAVLLAPNGSTLGSSDSTLVSGGSNLAHRWYAILGSKLEILRSRQFQPKFSHSYKKELVECETHMDNILKMLFK